MSFSSSIFIFYFFPISLIVCAVINKISYKLLKPFLLMFSYIFCYWLGKITFIFIIIVSIFLYIYSLQKRNKTFLFVSIILIVLFLFKIISYINIDNYYVNKIVLLQPVALSFVSLSAISFCFDLYNTKDEYNLNFFDISLYISFFPKYISGPIILWDDFKKELDNIEISIDNYVDGIILFIKGFFYKVVIADSLYYSIEPIIVDYTSFNSLSLLLTIFVYSFVIYFDFMGYSEMARGVAKTFGFDFKPNFDYPYISCSLNEFYRKWHISLGNFFKKYVYIPLGGNTKRVYFNIFIVMLLSGIWHGNGFAYLLWGIITGLLMIVERKYIKRNKIIFIIINYLIVCVLWLPFMLGSVKEIVRFISCIFTNNEISSLYNINYYFNIRTILILIIAILLSFVKLKGVKKVLMKNSIIYYAFIIIIFITSISFMINSTYAPFIYFRF